jgi:hypothetical protein
MAVMAGRGCEFWPRPTPLLIEEFIRTATIWSQNGGRWRHGERRHRAGARDARLDLFRGLAMLIIFVAHVPENPWIDRDPGPVRPSDAAEMFVFCSGFASALAFGGTFRRHGMALGCLRIANRCWQLYWSQFCLVLATAALLYWATGALGTRDYLTGPTSGRCSTSPGGRCSACSP